MHDVLVGHVAVGEDDLVDTFLSYEVVERVLGNDGNAVRVEGAGQFSGIHAPVDARNLGGGEGHDLGLRIVAVDHVEVVEVPPSRPHDHDSLAHPRTPLFYFRGHVLPGYG